VARSRWPLVAIVALVVTLSSCGARTVASPGPEPAVLHVQGNRILDRFQRPVQFHGVNRSGTEYACIQGFGIFDGPSDAASVAAMAAWHINIVRIPLNEDCWLGINGVKRQFSRARYVKAIVTYVNLLHAHGIYAELSLIWGAPGTAKADYQPDAPDEDHSPAMWAGMARAFKHDPNVILAPWGETTVTEQCFVDGCRDQASYGTGPWDGDTSCGKGCFHYTVAGMAQAVRVMRGAGYTGIIAIPGVDFANDLSGWLKYEPPDPRHQLIAEAHVYQKQICSTVKCFGAEYAPVAARVPLLWGETGEVDCGSRWIDSAVPWAAAHTVGYEAWTWDKWGTCASLIKNYGGAPANRFGRWIKSFYANFAAPVDLIRPRSNVA